MIGRALSAGAPLPPARRAARRWIVHPTTGERIDHGLMLRFDAPASFTGEDVIELHVHGGRAVLSGVLAAAVAAGARLAEPGEFTRRAFDAGRLDLAQVEGLADLVAADTDSQRRLALAQADGVLGRALLDWRAAVLALLAGAQAELDFGEEEPDVAAGSMPADTAAMRGLADTLRRAAAGSNAAERVRDGLVVVVAGPPNAGKSSLVNALAGRAVAIVTARAGTTRDPVEVHFDLGGTLLTLVDTAGLRDRPDDEAEAEGIARARARAARADLVLDLGGAAIARVPALCVVSKIDLSGGLPGIRGDIAHVSARTGAGIAELMQWLRDWASRDLGPVPSLLVANARQASGLRGAADELDAAAMERDPVLVAERLRRAAAALGEVTGHVSSEEVLGAIFGRFCIGK